MMGKILTTDIVDFLDDADIPGTKNSSPCACTPFSTSDFGSLSTVNPQTKSPMTCLLRSTTPRPSNR